MEMEKQNYKNRKLTGSTFLEKQAFNNLANHFLEAVIVAFGIWTILVKLKNDDFTTVVWVALAIILLFLWRKNRTLLLNAKNLNDELIQETLDLSDDIRNLKENKT